MSYEERFKKLKENGDVSPEFEKLFIDLLNDYKSSLAAHSDDDWDSK